MTFEIVTMPRKIKILLVETGNHGGGSFGSLYQTVEHLDRSRFLPIVVFLNRTRYVDKIRELGIKVVVIGDFLYNNSMPDFMKRILVGLNWGLALLCPRLTLFYEWMIHVRPIMKLRRLVKTEKVDIIHLNNNMVRHFFGVIGLRCLGIPIISYLRSFIIRGANPYMADFSNRHVSCYVAYSEGIRDYWGKVGVDVKNVHIIHNGIHIEEIEPLNVWKRMGIEPRRGPLIGCIGAIKVNRTYDFMIRSMVHILKDEPEAFLIIVGKRMDRGLGEKLERLAEDLEISKSVRFHGQDLEARRIIAGLDVMTIPYRVEPFGRILLEAWLVGTPVVATRVGRIEDIITNGRDGLLVDHGEEIEMRDAVLKFWRDEHFRHHVTTEGRRTVERKFSIEQCTRQLELLYEKILIESKYEGR